MFNGEFTKFRGWWEPIQGYLRIYASHIPDDITRIDVVSTYFKDNALLWYEARECFLDLKGTLDTWTAFSSKLEERFTDKQEIAKDYKRILAVTWATGMGQVVTSWMDHVRSSVEPLTHIAPEEIVHRGTGPWEL